MKKEKVLEETRSVCPECFKEGKRNLIDAKIVEKEGKIWMEKECEEHGEFESIYSNDASFYERMMDYKATGRKNPEVTGSCGLYDEHRSQSVLTNIFVTNRCNLRCDFCFANAGAEGFVYEPPLKELERMMEQVREEEPVPSKAIQITGGEPTLRKDLTDIIEKADELGFTHIQLNTNGLKLAGKEDYCRELKEAGVNTVYLSFDGVSKETNPWIEEHKRTIETLRKADLGAVLVPTVINDRNDHELGDIVKYAKNNVDVIRGVNFQPVSFVGRLKGLEDEDRKKGRITYSEMVGKLGKQLDGKIKKEDWETVPFVRPVSKLVEKLTGEPQVGFTAHPGCGVATYIFLDDGEIKPIKRFIDVEGFMDSISENAEKSDLVEKVEGEVPSPIQKLIRYGEGLKTPLSLFKEAPKYIDEEKVPEGLDIQKLALDAVIKGGYEALGKFHEKSLFLGSMWFQDPWNLSSERLKRCVIHYATPEGVFPFCTYNGMGLGHKIRKKHGTPIKEWEQKTGKSLADDLYEGPLT